jgi:hypothetical protein
VYAAFPLLAAVARAAETVKRHGRRATNEEWDAMAEALAALDSHLAEHYSEPNA